MTTHSCVQASDEIRAWIILAIAIPSVINVIIIALFGWTLVMMRSFKSIAEEIISSTHWLARTSVRVGIGPSAKKALLEYARQKPELAKLVVPSSAK